MITQIINSLLGFLTQPYTYIQKFPFATSHFYLPVHLDEKSWYTLFGFMTFLAFIIAFMLNRCVALQNGDDTSMYQHAQCYSLQRKHEKVL